MKIKHNSFVLIVLLLIIRGSFCFYIGTVLSSASPENSECFVTLYKDSSVIASFTDIDSALTSITDATSEYVVILNNEKTEYTITSDKTPDAKKITIKAESNQTDVKVSIASELFTVSSSLEFANITVNFNKISLGTSAISFNRVKRVIGNELSGESASSVSLNYSTLNITLIDVGMVTSVGFSFTEGAFYADKVKGSVSFGVPLGSDNTYKVDIDSYYMINPDDCIRVESGGIWNGKAGKIDIVIDRIYHSPNMDFAFINILYNKEAYPKITIKDADCHLIALLMPFTGININQTDTPESVNVCGTPDLNSVNVILKDINGTVSSIYKAENDNSVGFIGAIGFYFRNLTAYSAITSLIPDSEITSEYQHLTDGRIFVKHDCSEYKTYWYTVPATTTADGQTVYKCKLCESKYIETIPKIKEGVTITGIIKSCGLDKTVSTVELLLNGITVKTATVYNDYLISGVNPGEYVLRVSKQNHVTREYKLIIESSDVIQNVDMWLIGDVDGNGVINTIDWNTIRDHITGLSTITDEYMLAAADINGDGNISTMDWNGVRDDITQLTAIHSEWTEETIITEDPVEETIQPFYIGKTNEETCYNYFTMVMNLNTAAASGILANIKAESSFRNNNLEGIYEKSLGYTDASYTAAVDSGEYKNFTTDKAGYGLFQWTSEERKEEYYKFVKSRGVSISDISAQLDFFAIEIKSKSRYRLAWETLTTVWNDADGAYEAGYSVCYNFERPSDRASRSVTRGNSARDTYFAKYNVSLAD